MTSPRRRAQAALAAAAMVSALAGCGGATGGATAAASGSSRPAPATTTPAPPASPTPPPNGGTGPVGTTIAVSDSAGDRLTLLAGHPSVSRTRLSSDYGYPPAHGYYLTFPMTVHDVGSSQVLVRAQSFTVSVPGAANVTLNDGNAPYSGASQQFDTTVAVPGDTLSEPLTFDVPAVHGTLSFHQAGFPKAQWTF